MNFPGFCNAHKRWFNENCDYCEREEYNQMQREVEDEYRRLSRSHVYKTAHDWSILLAVHATCGHLVTDAILCADGYNRTILFIQMLAFELEYAEIL